MHGDVEDFVVEQRGCPFHSMDARNDPRHNQARSLIQLLLLELRVLLQNKNFVVSQKFQACFRKKTSYLIGGTRRHA